MPGGSPVLLRHPFRGRRAPRSRQWSRMPAVDLPLPTLGSGRSHQPHLPGVCATDPRCRKGGRHRHSGPLHQAAGGSRPRPSR
eukprot:14123157-Alexandrium_andersonii.AAC.1